MTVRIAHILDNVYDSTGESVSAAYNFSGITPKRISLYVNVHTIVGATTESLDISVDVSPDDGQTYLNYDKLLDQNGQDAPQSTVSIALNAESSDVFSLSPEDVVDNIRVVAAADSAGGTPLDANNSAEADIWLVFEY